MYEQVFCTECGTTLSGARYCPQCGIATDNGAVEAGPPATSNGSITYAVQALAVPEVEPTVRRMTSAQRGPMRATSYTPRPMNPPPPSVGDTLRPPPPTPAEPQPARPGGWRYVLVGVVVTALLGAIAAAAVIALSSDSSSARSHAKQAQAARQPVSRSRADAAANRRALTQFSGQVQSLLTQSASAYQQINQLFGQLQTAADGGNAGITLAQAESTISTVVANRTSLAASARTLNAPTNHAASVRDALVAAYDASLTDDQDIDNCLNQANTGTIAFIFQGCLSASAADSNTATAAKQHFAALYNSLRQRIGEPATDQPF